MQLPKSYNITELKIIAKNFCDELKKAYLNLPSSLSFFINPLPKPQVVLPNKIIQVMVFGGTIFKSTSVKSPDFKFKNDKIKKLKTPFFSNEKIFFDFIINQLNKKADYLAINFAYPLKPILRNNRLDGKLLYSTKEHNFGTLIGKNIGEEIKKYIYQKQKRIIKVTIINDVVALLLSGIFKNENWQNLCAGIVGTGTNFAFFIDKKTAVNLESGNFNKFPLTLTGKIINQNSSEPNKQLFEKEIAGAYLYLHYNLIKNKDNFNTPLKSTIELSKKAKKGDILAKKILEHSASLIASQIAGTYQFKKLQTNNPHLKLKIIMEGSLFWQGYQYQNYIRRYLKFLDGLDKKIEFIKIKNSQILGVIKLLI
ncbi:MAG: hexokinase family protein [Minisyncoccia bacterium]